MKTIAVILITLSGLILNIAATADNDDTTPLPLAPSWSGSGPATATPGYNDMGFAGATLAADQKPIRTRE